MKFSILKKNKFIMWLFNSRNSTTYVLSMACIMPVLAYVIKNFIIKGYLSEKIIDSEYYYFYQKIMYLLPDIFCYLVLPYIATKIMSINFTFDGFRMKLKHQIMIILCCLILIPIMAIYLKSYGDFKEIYPILRDYSISYKQLIIFEIFMFMYIYAWEYFVRGFILSGLYKRYGFDAIIIQTIVFTLLHFDKPILELVLSIPGGIALGILAVKTRSINLGVVIHAILFITFDVVFFISMHS